MTEEENAQENQEDKAEQQSKATASKTEELQKGTQPEPAPNVTVKGEVFEADEITEDEDEDEEENEEHIFKEEDDVDDEELAENEELNAAALEALFNKNTSSFRCLAQMLLSRSSLLRHPLYHFPPLEDPGIDAAFYYVEPEEPIDNVCIERYKQVCKEFNIVPLSRVIKSLPTKELNLRYYSLTTKEVKAVAIALKLNTFVEELNLEENFLYPDSAYYIEELLRENNTLKVLNMKQCRIGPEGAQILNDGIMLTQSLVELDLSYNDLGTAGLKALVSAFKENGTIKRLNLAHNNLNLDCAPDLASILKENLVLDDLDLSWNNLGTAQAMKIVFNEGISVNCVLRSINLAWNGITLKAAVRPLTRFIKKSALLEVLDLSNNRIRANTLNMIKNAIKKSQSIRGLNLAFNPLTPDNAQAIADVLVMPKGPPAFELLDMENVFVKKDFIPTLVKADKMDKTIKISGILGNWKIIGPDVIKLLFNRARLLAMKPKRKKAKRDFSHFILGLPDRSMKKSDFEASAKKFKMKMVDNDLLAEIIKLFPYKKKSIDCAAIKQKYMELFPDAQPAPPKKKKKKGKGKKKKKGGTDPSVTNLTNSGVAIATEGESSALVPDVSGVPTTSADKLERSRPPSESKQRSSTTQNHDVRHSVVSFSITSEQVDDGRAALLEQSDVPNEGADTAHEIDSDHQAVNDSRHLIKRVSSPESAGRHSRSSRDSGADSMHSSAFTVKTEEGRGKSNSEPLPTIPE